MAILPGDWLQQERDEGAECGFRLSVSLRALCLRLTDPGQPVPDPRTVVPPQVSISNLVSVLLARDSVPARGRAVAVADASFRQTRPGSRDQACCWSGQRLALVKPGIYAQTTTRCSKPDEGELLGDWKDVGHSRGVGKPTVDFQQLLMAELGVRRHISPACSQPINYRIAAFGTSLPWHKKDADWIFLFH